MSTSLKSNRKKATANERLDELDKAIFLMAEHIKQLNKNLETLRHNQKFVLDTLFEAKEGLDAEE